MERDGQVLLVENRRRDGGVDWSPPGGVIEDGEAVLNGLAREVAEETGLVIDSWDGLLWTTHARSESMGFTMVAEVYLAQAAGGLVAVDDPDGIVTAAEFVAHCDVEKALAATWRPTKEPFLEWLTHRWTEPREFRYSVEGPDRASMVVELLSGL